MTNPYIVSLASLARQEGSILAWEEVLEAADGLGGDLMNVPAGSDLDVRLTLSSVSEGVYVAGTVTATVVGRCSRCLRDISGKESIDVAELVYYPERREALVAEGDEEVEEAPVVSNDQIDLEPVLRDAIVPSLPFSPLCREDCPGLCPDCGTPWDELPEDHSHGPAYDPRFDALAALEAQLKEEE